MRYSSGVCVFVGACARAQEVWLSIQVHSSQQRQWIVSADCFQLSWPFPLLFVLEHQAVDCYFLFVLFLFVCVSQQNQVLQISVCVTDECVHSQLSLHSHSAGSVGLHLAKQELNQLLIEQRNRAWFSVTQSQNLHNSIFPNNDHINPLSLTVVMSCISYLVHDFLLLCVILPQWHHLPPQNVILPKIDKWMKGWTYIRIDR